MRYTGNKSVIRMGDEESAKSIKILFLSLLDFNSVDERNIYTDLLREFIKNGHEVCAISPVESRKNEKTHVIYEDSCRILKLRIGNTQKTSIIEKGISTLLIEPQFILGIKRYFRDVKFDLILYATPPITFCRVIEYVKYRDGARSYLMLKDIFPQNAVDIGIMSKAGIKAPLYRYFRTKEKRLYNISDRIGCMSLANVKYVFKNNSETKRRHIASIKANGKGIVEICPNSVEPMDLSLTDEERSEIRKKYNISLDKIVFVYGGNLGKPQGIPFLIECLQLCEDLDNVYFLIVGDGTEYSLLYDYMKKEKPDNVKLMSRLPKEDYDSMVAACDVGMIFLDHRFTIPNFPSRLLSYLQAKLPVLACTDPNTDIGDVIVGGGFGWWCESNDSDRFKKIVSSIKKEGLTTLGNLGYKYLVDYYDTKKGYQMIMK